MVTHDIKEAVLIADRIIVLCEDGVREQGSHSELMALKGEYFNLYSQYSD